MTDIHSSHSTRTGLAEPSKSASQHLRWRKDQTHWRQANSERSVLFELSIPRENHLCLFRSDEEITVDAHLESILASECTMVVLDTIETIIQVQEPLSLPWLTVLFVSPDGFRSFKRAIVIRSFFRVYWKFFFTPSPWIKVLGRFKISSRINARSFTKSVFLLLRLPDRSRCFSSVSRTSLRRRYRTLFWSLSSLVETLFVVSKLDPFSCLGFALSADATELRDRQCQFVVVVVSSKLVAFVRRRTSLEWRCKRRCLYRG